MNTECPHCRHQNIAGTLVCTECSTIFSLSCQGCGASLDHNAKFCSECGLPKVEFAEGRVAWRFKAPHFYTPQHLAEKILTSRSALEGERKVVTVIFCDIVGSTSIAERVGAEHMHSLINQFFGLALQKIHQYEGTINQFLGDGFMALFGAPLTYEDHAQRAVRAVLDLQDHLGADADDFMMDGGRLSVRIALNTGPVVVGKIGNNLRMDYTAVGDTTNLAARIQSLTEPGAVYISEHTHRMVQEDFECTCLGTRQIIGKAHPVVIYKVMGMQTPSVTLSRRSARFLSSRLVGRMEEVRTLRARVDRLFDGQGGLVSIGGEAGVGKSRLLFELKRELGGTQVLWLEGRTVSYSRMISYLPFREIIRAYAGIVEGDPDAASWSKLAVSVGRLFPNDAENLLPFLATLSGVKVTEDHERRMKDITGEAMGLLIHLSTYRFLERLATQAPLILVFEDIHWLDQSSVVLMEHLFKLVGTVPLVICWVSRPEQQGPPVQLHQIATQKYQDRYTAIDLSPLPIGDCHILIDNLLKSDALSPRLRELINTRAEGNPFFIEETIRSLVEAKVLLFDEKHGQWQSASGAEDVQIPETLEGVIMARVDQLDEESKEIVKIASVIGRSFLRRILLAITQAEGALDGHLRSLQEMGLIRERRKLPELEYIFKHALTQKAIYLSLLQKRRQDLHRLVGQCLEQFGLDRVEGNYGLLAYHYVQAGAWEKALEFLLKAGDQAGGMAADVEALDHYQQALDAYVCAFGDRWDPVQRAMLERKIGEARFRRGEHMAATEHLIHASSLLGYQYPSSRWGIRLSILRELFSHLTHRKLWCFTDTMVTPARTPASQERREILLRMPWMDWFINQERFVLDALILLNVSERTQFLYGAAVGSACVGLICDFVSFSKMGERCLQRALSLADKTDHPIARVVSHFMMGIHEQHLNGKWPHALTHFRRTAEVSREANDLRGWGMASFWIAWILRAQGKFAHSLDLSRELIRLGEASGDKLIYSYGIQGLGRTLYCMGDTVAAIQQWKECVEVYKSLSIMIGMALSYTQLGKCYLRHGVLQQAIDCLEEGHRYVTNYNLIDHTVGDAYISLAYAHITVARQSTGQQRFEELKKGEHALKAGRKSINWSAEAKIQATRTLASCEWLKGRTSRAMEQWQETIAHAEEIGAKYELGITYLEMGEYLGSSNYLKQAEEVLGSMGAKYDLAQAQKSLSLVGRS